MVDVHYPHWVLAGKEDFYQSIRQPEFAAQIKDYLATIGPQYPKTIEEMIDRAEKFNGTRADGAGPNVSRWALFKVEAASGPLTSSKYIAVHDYVLPAVRTAVEGVINENKLDAIVYPTSSRRTPLIATNGGGGGGAPDRSFGGGTNLQNLTGFPDLIVPAGFSGEDLPVAISFVGPAFSEGKLLGLGYSFEKLTHARRRPVNTPPLANDDVPLPAGG
jgi:amidase